MAAYDSDSSGVEDDYTETNVLLGYASKEPTGDTISHLGGRPAWLDEKTAPPGNFAKCKVCNSLLTQLLQLNGDLPEHFPGHERRLYIWSCRKKTCRRKEGSVRGIRGIRVNQAKEPAATAMSKDAQPPAEEKKQQQTNIGESLFGVSGSKSSNTFSTSSANPFASNPFAPSSSALQHSNPFAGTVSLAAKAPQLPETTASNLPETFASKVRLSSPTPASSPLISRPHEPWPSESDFPPPYPQYYLDADYETLDKPSAPAVPTTASMDIDGEGSGSAGGSGQEDKEVFESSLDKTFQRFADRVGQNPEQVLRYEFRGAPLLYAKSDAVGKLFAHTSSDPEAKVKIAGPFGGAGMPRCANCGAERVFEVQLTPHAITELELEEEGLEGMEWGTIILGVCGKDCAPADVKQGDVGYLEEWVGVQWEETKGKRV